MVGAKFCVILRLYVSVFLNVFAVFLKFNCGCKNRGCLGGELFLLSCFCYIRANDLSGGFCFYKRLGSHRFSIALNV